MALQNVVDGANGTDTAQKQDHAGEETNDISSKYETPAAQTSASYSALKDRIKGHYEMASDYYYSLWYIDLV